MGRYLIVCRIIVTGSLLLSSLCAYSLDVPFYYGQRVQQILNGKESDENLRSELQKVLSSWHLPSKNGFDQIVEKCSSQQCYRHEPLTYKDARKVVFGDIHLVMQKNSYAVQDVYCDTLRTKDQFPSNPPGPGKIPNPQIVNAEHTWPQSRFSRSFPKDLQKADLHGLYSVDSRANSSRSNDPFGEVSDSTSQVCPASKKGHSRSSGRIVFEPPDNHKGNVARALFYFAIRYQLNIDSEQESYLREWNQLDPVDENEIQRQQIIFESQGNRNPFVDIPELINHIEDL